MEKLLKQYEDYVQTLSEEEIAYLKTLNPRKLEGGMNETGLKNTILSYRMVRQPHFWENLFIKYKDMIFEACYADEIIYCDIFGDEDSLYVNRIRKDED